MKYVMAGKHVHPDGFVSEPNIEAFFKGLKPKPKIQFGQTTFGQWYKTADVHPFTYGHDVGIGSGHFNCDSITDEWYRWFLTTPKSENVMTRGDPYDTRNSVLMDKQETFVYFAAASPFREPFDFKTIVMIRRAPLLVPIYNVVASVQQHPSVLHDPKRIDSQLTEIVKEDLAGVGGDTVYASFDGQPFYGCCVIREKVLKIPNIPDNNLLGIPPDRLRETSSTIELCHGGFWLLIKEEKFKPGDHLLKFAAHSQNYEIQAKLLITAAY